MTRHLDPASFDEYLAASVPIDHVIRGEPRMVLFFDPTRSEIGLRLHAAPQDRAWEKQLENVTVRQVIRQGNRTTEVVVGDRHLFTQGYALLCSIADRVQIERMSLAAALSETVRSLNLLIKPVQSLSPEREIGLFGELLFLEQLLETMPVTEAVDCWLGPHGEEHDFSFGQFDVEIKTTVSERRSHWVESLTQLVEAPGRDLWLVSVQITRGAKASGDRLSDLIDRISDRLEGPERLSFEKALETSGWDDRLRSETARRYFLRSRPTSYKVDGSFPRLEPGILAAAGVGKAIAEVRYRIDLSDTPASQLPGGLKNVFSTGGDS
ncbi:PD-(D/E)XK motif protein [Kitasatospora indigofera]|uniref:PD-(D/E)XK motif protein n=1 Tax=Kitasatospora indigofera TaxID=67307 RepID=UPI0036594175